MSARVEYITDQVWSEGDRYAQLAALHDTVVADTHKGFWHRFNIHPPVSYVRRPEDETPDPLWRKIALVAVAAGIAWLIDEMIEEMVDSI